MPKYSKGKSKDKGGSSSGRCESRVHDFPCGPSGPCVITAAQAHKEFKSRWSKPPEPEPETFTPEHDDWRYHYFKYWRHISCPCERGYFCRPHGQWIPGAVVPDEKARQLDQLGLHYECNLNPSIHGALDKDPEYPEYEDATGGQLSENERLQSLYPDDKFDDLSSVRSSTSHHNSKGDAPTCDDFEYEQQETSIIPIHTNRSYNSDLETPFLSVDNPTLEEDFLNDDGTFFEPAAYKDAEESPKHERKLSSKKSHSHHHHRRSGR